MKRKTEHVTIVSNSSTSVVAPNIRNSTTYEKEMPEVIGNSCEITINI